MPSKKRDTDYYLERMRLEQPAIYADYMAGKFKNASEAIVHAGLRKPPDALAKLLSAWAKASDADRDAFLQQIGRGSSPVVAPGTATPAGSIHNGGYLTQETADAIRAVVTRRGIAAGKVMGELGFSRLNPSLGLALHRGTKIGDPAVLAAIPGWLAKHSPAGRKST